MLPNIGAQELLIIFVIALVVVGPKKLPELGRAIGRGLNEFKKIQDEVRDMVKFDLNEDPPAATPRMSNLPELEPGPGIEGETDEHDDADADPETREMTHSERVVALASDEPAEEPPSAEPATEDPSPWIYDAVDDDPDAEPPASGSAE